MDNAKVTAFTMLDHSSAPETIDLTILLGNLAYLNWFTLLFKL